jgi:predicted exporter
MATGPVLFATEQRERARGEIALLSSLSLTGILLLVLLAFRSPRPILLGVLALATGVLVAVATSLLFFGRVHAITLIAGTTLLGIAIDYVFKYLVHRSEAVGGTGADVVLRYRRPLLLGVASSLLSLVVLALSPLPVMRELAVFSAAGLAGAWLTVVLAFPALDGAGSVRLSNRVATIANALPARMAAPGGLRLLIVLIVLPLGAVAFIQMPGNDDLRDFQSPMPERLAIDSTVRELTGTAYPSGFFVVTGPDVATVLEREAALLERLDAAAGHHQALALSRFMPPASEQVGVRRMVGEALESQAVADLLIQIGMGEPAIEALRLDWRASEGNLLRPGSVSAGPLAELVDGLWLDTGSTPASLVIPRGGAGAMQSAGPGEGVRFVQPVEMMNAGLSEQRAGATRWIMAAAVIGMPLLFLFILGFRRGIMAVAAPLAALAATLSFLWLAGIGMNTFVLMGVILALGVGADYAAFLAAEDDASRAGVTGIALAALTSMLAFGLLGLSGIPALRDFGLTVVAGILSAWLAAFILVGTGRRNES